MSAIPCTPYFAASIALDCRFVLYSVSQFWRSSTPGVAAMWAATEALNAGASTGITFPFSLYISVNSRFTFSIVAICRVFSSLPCTSPLRSSHNVCHDVYVRPVIAEVHNFPDSFLSSFDIWRSHFPWRSAHSVHMRPLKICLHPMAFWALIRSWVMSG